MILSRAQRAMLHNARTYITTVSRDADRSGDPLLAHTLAEVSTRVFQIVTENERAAFNGVATRVLPFPERP